MRRVPTGAGERRSSRAVIWIVVAAMLAAACSGTDEEPDSIAPSAPPTATDGTGTPTGTTEPSSIDSSGSPGAEGSRDADVSELVDAGVVVIADEYEPVPDAPFVVTQVQAERLVAGVDAGGILGSEIDELAPVPEDVPPISYLLAAWVAVGETAAAQTARGWMGEQPWELAPSIVFPHAVVSLFVTDLATMVDAAADEAGADPFGEGIDPVDLDATGLRMQPAGLRSESAALLGGVANAPCSTVDKFLGDVIHGLFGALRLTVPSKTGGFFAKLAATLATVWNTVLDYAQGVVESVVGVLKEQVFDIIRLAVGALGVAEVVVSYFRDEVLTVAVEKVDAGAAAGGWRFSIGDELPIRGMFVAKAKDLTGNWPRALLDCAKSAGAPLPKLIEPYAQATWTEDDPRNVIETEQLVGAVSDDLAARLAFNTGSESEEAAKGELTSGTATVTVTIPRPEIEQFVQLGRNQIENAWQHVLSTVPRGELRTAVDGLKQTVVQPTIDRVQSGLNNAVGGFFSLRGRQSVTVAFHIPPEPTTTTEPPSTPPPTITPPPMPTNACNLVPTEVVVGTVGLGLSPLLGGPNAGVNALSCGWSLDGNAAAVLVSLGVYDAEGAKILRELNAGVFPVRDLFGWPGWSNFAGDDSEEYAAAIVDFGTWALNVYITAYTEEDAVQINEAMALAIAETAVRAAGG